MWHKTAIFACLKIILCKLKISIFDGKNVHVSQAFSSVLWGEAGRAERGKRCSEPASSQGENHLQGQISWRRSALIETCLPTGGRLRDDFLTFGIKNGIYNRESALCSVITP